MKRIKLLAILSCILLSSAAQCQSTKSRSEQRRMMQDYFLCKCLTNGFEEKNLTELDHSETVYFELLAYDPEAIHKVDSLSKAFVGGIEFSNYEGRSRKGIIILCIDQHKSQEVKRFIKSLDGLHDKVKQP